VLRRDDVGGATQLVDGPVEPTAGTNSHHQESWPRDRPGGGLTRPSAQAPRQRTAFGSPRKTAA
jgi:hypothetical protein